MANQLAQRDRKLIASICADYRTWAPGESAAPQVVSTLSRGYNNAAVLLAGRQDQWVLRLGRVPAPDGVSREREADIQATAAALGLAPEILWQDCEQGILLMAFCPWTGEPPSIDKVTDLLRRIHTLPLSGSEVRPLNVLHKLRHALVSTSALARLMQEHAEPIKRACTEVSRPSPHTPVLCHHDLLPANCGRGQQGPLALDWEYAAPGDPLFDLAVSASAFPQVSSREVLHAYLQRPASAAEFVRFDAFVVIYRCIEACWHALYSGAASIVTESQVRLQQVLQETGRP